MFSIIDQLRNGFLLLHDLATKARGGADYEGINSRKATRPNICSSSYLARPSTYVEPAIGQRRRADSQTKRGWLSRHRHVNRASVLQRGGGSEVLQFYVPNERSGCRS